MKGRVKAFKDHNGEPIGPQRVWLKHEDIPGLAMSRSLGDRVAHSVGVSAEPEITEYILAEHNKIIVLASDGVWEFLSNEDVCRIVTPFFERGSPELAANAVVKAAFARWREEEDVIDDITVIVLFLNPTSDPGDSLAVHKTKAELR